MKTSNTHLGIAALIFILIYTAGFASAKNVSSDFAPTMAAEKEYVALDADTIATKEGCLTLFNSIDR